MFEPSKRLENGIGDQWIISLIWSLGFTHGKFCRHCQVRRETILRNFHSSGKSGRSADQYLGLLLVLLFHFELLDSSNGKVLIFLIDMLTHCFFFFFVQVSIPPLIILVKLRNSDKYPEVTVVLATISSFFFLYFLHASIVILRHTLDAMSIEVNPHQMWVIKVIKSSI